MQQDIAFYFLARGDYAYIGYNVWGMGWPFNPEPPHGTVPAKAHGVPVPEVLTDPSSVWNNLGTPEFDTETGEVALCKETSANSNIFTREYTQATLTLDCTEKFAATVVPKQRSA